MWLLAALRLQSTMGRDGESCALKKYIFFNLLTVPTRGIPENVGLD